MQIQLSAVRQNATAIAFIGDLNKEQIQLPAVKQNATAIEFIRNLNN